MMTLSGYFEGQEHILPLCVYYEDTDAAWIVYYANYLKFAERARRQLLRLVGINQAALSRDHGLALAVRDCSVDYRRPARLDDPVEVRSRLGGASVRADQRTARDGSAARIPAALRAALMPFCFSQDRI